MRFQVPQFTEVEDKIFGPLTFKQFVYLIGGSGGLILLYFLLPLFLVIILGIPIAAFSLALAFYKVNNQPFVKIVQNALVYFSSSKLFLWQKREPKKKISQPEEKAKESPLYTPKLTKGKLNDLAWSLDIKEKLGR